MASWKDYIAKNRVRGIVPVSTVFTTVPTDLGNCTDGESTSVTGTGSRTTYANNCGILTFDIGKKGVFLVGARVGSWCDSNSVANSAFIESSEDNATWNTAYTASATWQNTSETIDSFSKAISGQYFRLRFYIGNFGISQTMSVKIYEVWAWEMNP